MTVTNGTAGFLHIFRRTTSTTTSSTHGSFAEHVTLPKCKFVGLSADPSVVILLFGVTFPGVWLLKSDRGRSMPFIPPKNFDRSSFSLFKDSMLQSQELPLFEALDEQRFQRAFEEHSVDFGNDPNAVYTPAITLWALISQAFFKGEHRSCQAAVTRVALLGAAMDRRVCDTNTGAYCRARAKIPHELVRTLTTQLADEAHHRLLDGEVLADEQAQQQRTPSVLAEVKSQPRRGRLLLVDGFTITAADTPANQAEYPQNPAQAEGLGFPILRCVSLVSLESGMLVDLACGPYCGKETGETALMWQLLETLQPGDILVADSCYCSYWLVGACHSRDVEIVMKNHQSREDHPEDAVELGDGERYVCWQRPRRPDWMSEEDYQRQPQELWMRYVDVQVERNGFRPEAFTVATTMLRRSQFPASWIRSIYLSRWLEELDIRSIKCSLGMDILRAKSPAMVRTELWSCLLAYNLIRMKMLQSCSREERDPRSVSFTVSQQLLGTNWLLGAVIGVPLELAELGRRVPCSVQVGHREGRIEPRENKRRPKLIALMMRPRAERRADLLTAA